MVLYKYEATGNDFILIDQEVKNPSLLAKKVCDRHFGIGADGLMFPTWNNGQVYMNYYNADGSIAPMCGNGIRAFTKFLLDLGTIDSKEVVINTLAGPMNMTIHQDSYTVNLGSPEVSLSEPLLKFETKGLEEISLSINHQTVKGYPINLGTIHFVVYVNNLNEYDDIATFISNHEVFPSKINVNFVQVLDKNSVRIKTFERGVGWTLSCGTGSSSSAYVSYLLGKTNKDITVIVPGGTLTVEIKEDQVYLTGPANKVAKIDFSE